MFLRLFIFILALLAGSSASAYQFKGDIYTEAATQDLNSSSAFNPGNMHQVGDTQYFLRSNLIFKNDFSEHLNGNINIEGQYYPAYYTLFHPFAASDSKAQENGTKERVFIKEAYLDVLTSVFVVRVGKQYIKWGKGTFFNPSDVVNFNRDPLRPIDEAEGNPFMSLSIPIQSFLTLEAITVIDDKQDQPQRTKTKNQPIIPKISFSAGSLSGFGFAVFQNNRQPIFGLNLDYAFSLADGFNVTLYSEGVYLLHSYRERVNDSYAVEPMQDKNYQALVIGSRTQIGIKSLKWLDGIALNVEYYYNNENWSSHEFNNYLGKLNTDKAVPTTHLQDIASYYTPYRNSRHYGYASVYLTNFIVQQFTFGHDFVFNFEDKSSIYMPSIAYAFDNSNAEVGLKAIIYSGDSKSEFGNAISKWNIIAYTQLSF